jgi:hypothetical protein
MKKSNLIALAKTMISTSFPALRGMTLKLKIIDSEDYAMAVALEGKEIHLDVSREDAARMGRSVVTGLLAHELCHAEEDCRQGPVLEALFSWLYERIPSLKTRMERRIDAAVIRKGYGNELLAFQRYHDRIYEPYDQTDGMTVEEIEEALRTARGAWADGSSWNQVILPLQHQGLKVVCAPIPLKKHRRRGATCSPAPGRVSSRRWPG